MKMQNDFFLEGLGPAAKNWPFLRGRLLLGYGVGCADSAAPPTHGPHCARPVTFSTRLALRLGVIVREKSCEQPVKRAFTGQRNWENLTPQELNIAQLAAQGLSNKVIGARLYLSHRTVGYHLQRVFSKMGSSPDPVLSFLPHQQPGILIRVCHRTGHLTDAARFPRPATFRGVSTNPRALAGGRLGNWKHTTGCPCHQTSTGNDGASHPIDRRVSKRKARSTSAVSST